jgi:hypothetical protein
VGEGCEVPVGLGGGVGFRRDVPIGLVPKFWYALPQMVPGPPWQSPPPVSILQPPFFEQGCGCVGGVFMQFLVPGLHAISTTSLVTTEPTMGPLGNAETWIVPPTKKRPATVRTFMQTNSFFMPISVPKDLNPHKPI